MKPSETSSVGKFSDALPQRKGLVLLRQSLSSLLALLRNLQTWTRRSTTCVVLEAEADAMQALAGRLRGTAASKLARWEVIMPSAWIDWASIPWMGPKLRDVERSAVMRQRLNALYGPSMDWYVAVGRGRFGWGQWVAATSSLRIDGVKALLKANGYSKARLVPAHAVALSAYERWFTKQPITVAKDTHGTKDQLFATVDGKTLCVSWQRFTKSSNNTQDAHLGPALGIRNLSLHGAANLAVGHYELDEGKKEPRTVAEKWVTELVRSLQREILLQRLDRPHVVVVVRNWHSGIQRDAHAAGLLRVVSLDAYPRDWMLFQTQDWQALECLQASHSAVDARAQATTDYKLAGHRIQKSFSKLQFDFDLDFCRPSTIAIVKPVWPRWAMGVGLVLAILLGFVYQQQFDALTQLQQEMEQARNEKLAKDTKEMAGMRNGTSQTAEDRVVFRQREQVRASLAVPWGSLFQCIESSVGVAAGIGMSKGANSAAGADTAAGPDVTLSQIQPDPNGGELIIAGDARNYKAIGALVTRLEENGNRSGSGNKIASGNVSAAVATDAFSKHQAIGACRELRMPYISSFQVNEQDPQRTVHFEIHANWVRSQTQQSTTEPFLAQTKVPLFATPLAGTGAAP
jgi:hypothetical protein